MRRRYCVVLCACAMIAACDRAADTPEPAASVQPAGERATVEFDSAIATISNADTTVTVRIEVAERDDQRAFGLMDRDRLDPDAGMVFLYRNLQDPNSGFWMYRTRIPLDIAFFDHNGRIVAIRQMAPCSSPVPAQCIEEARNYRPGMPYTGALEVNRGFFAEHGFDVGDAIAIPGRVGG
ncbi:MAG TPA: DUF192 domain-containing protein [Longimicrobiales bacterium]|nr:DUF192 domain-containing protein [Longimicrobiales bacterium]